MVLIWLSASFLLGVIFGTAVDLPVPLTVGVAVAAAALAYPLRHLARLPIFLILAAFCLGLARAPHDSPPNPGDLAYYNGRWLTAQGTVAEEPDIRDTGANYVVAVQSIALGRKTQAVSGRIELHTPRSQALEYGDVVSLTGRLLTPQNSSAVPYRDILAQRGIGSQMRFPRVVDAGAGQSGPLGWVVPLRQRLEAGIDAWLPEPEAALLIAITLGARSATLGDLSPLLVSTGLIHIIAISGIKVALVAGILAAAARAGRNRHLVLVLSLAGLWGYVLLTGDTVSGERSAIMWSLIFVATYLGRNTVGLVSLSVAAAVMVAFDPTLPWNLSFLLSTVGTFAIVAFTEPLLRVLRYVPSPVRESLATTAAAQVGTAPIVIVGFHVLALTGPVSNALVLPLLPALIAVGFLLGAVSGLPVLAAPVGALGYALVHSVVQLVIWLAGLPGALPISPAAQLISLAYYLLIAGAAAYLLRHANWAPAGRWPSRGREASLALAVGASFLTFTIGGSHADTHPRLYWLGSGDSLLLSSGGRIVLIDGSPRPFELLQRLGQVIPYTHHAIDLLVVTDPRAGNVGALQDVLRHYRVLEVLDVGAEYPSTTYSHWRADLRARRIPVFSLRTAASVNVGAVHLTALGPDTLYPRPQDCIGILRLEMSGHRSLLVGNASTREQLEALFRLVDLHANTLILDGRNGAVPAFVRAVHPHRVFGVGDVRVAVRLGGTLQEVSLR